METPRTKSEGKIVELLEKLLNKDTPYRGGRFGSDPKPYIHTSELPTKIRERITQNKADFGARAGKCYFCSKANCILSTCPELKAEAKKAKVEWKRVFYRNTPGDADVKVDPRPNPPSSAATQGKEIMAMMQNMKEEMMQELREERDA